MTPTQIIFLCPHNAAKSVAAAAYLGREADRIGLSLSISTAGTHPDSEVIAVVSDRLKHEGLPVDSPPSLVTPADLSGADRIINIGCDHADLPTESPVTDWTVPDFSDDPDAAFASLRDQVASLARQLADPV